MDANIVNFLLGAGLTAALALLGFAFGYGSLSSQVRSNKEAILEIKTAITRHESYHAKAT